LGRCGRPAAERTSSPRTDYNFARPHQTLTKDNGGYKITPAMAAGITNRVVDAQRHRRATRLTA